MAEHDLIMNKGPRIALQTSGAVLAAGAYGAATTSDLLTTHNPGFPYFVLELQIKMVTSPIGGTQIAVYKQAQKVVTETYHEPNPSDSCQHGFLTSFSIRGSDSVQSWESTLIHRSALRDWKLWIHNGTNVSTDSTFGWSLWATPVAFGLAGE